MIKRNSHCPKFKKIFLTIPEGDPKSSAIQINFAAKPFDCLLGVMAIWSAGVLSWTQT